MKLFLLYCTDHWFFSESFDLTVECTVSILKPFTWGTGCKELDRSLKLLHIFWPTCQMLDDSQSSLSCFDEGEWLAKQLFLLKECTRHFGWIFSQWKGNTKVTHGWSVWNWQTGKDVNWRVQVIPDWWASKIMFRWTADLVSLTYSNWPTSKSWERSLRIGKVYRRTDWASFICACSHTPLNASGQFRHSKVRTFC